MEAATLSDKRKSEGKTTTVENQLYDLSEFESLCMFVESEEMKKQKVKEMICKWREIE